MSSNDLFVTLLCIAFAVTALAGFAGYESSTFGTWSGSDGTSQVSWIASAVAFFADMTSFKVENMPWVLSLIWDLFIIIWAWLGLRLIRGTT